MLIIVILQGKLETKTTCLQLLINDIIFQYFQIKFFLQYSNINLEFIPFGIN